jgi:TonB family protein
MNTTLFTAIAVALCFAAPAQAANSSKAVADFKTCAKPQYPAASLAAKHEGAVTLSFLIETDGAVREAKIKSSSGYDPLDEAARDAIKLCTFKPATKDGKAVEGWVDVKYIWTLK